MSGWILILIISSPYGKTIDHVSFYKRDQCEAAAKIIFQDYQDAGNMKVYCVEGKI